jgi:hypothetical protein
MSRGGTRKAETERQRDVEKKLRAHFNGHYQPEVAKSLDAMVQLGILDEIPGGYRISRKMREDVAESMRADGEEPPPELLAD